jgi:hypothetical protein
MQTCRHQFLAGAALPDHKGRLVQWGRAGDVLQHGPEGGRFADQGRQVGQ